MSEWIRGKAHPVICLAATLLGNARWKDTGKYKVISMACGHSTGRYINTRSWVYHPRLNARLLQDEGWLTHCDSFVVLSLLTDWTLYTCVI